MNFFLLNDDHSVRAVDSVEWFDKVKIPVRLAHDIVAGRFVVSTIFLGMGWGDPPRVFETMIFDGKSGPLDLWQRRYATWDEAMAGHAVAVKEAYAEALKGTKPRIKDEVDVGGQ